MPETLRNTVPSRAPAEASTQRAEIGFRVDVAEASGLLDVRACWRDLARRAAEPNVFVEPAFLEAAAQGGAAENLRIVLVWDAAGESVEPRLMGAWAFVMGRPNSGLPIDVLRAPAHHLGFLGTPVIDRGHVEAVLTAMLDALAGHPKLPKLIMVADMGMDGPVMAGLHRVLERRGAAPAVLRQTQRPILRPSTGGDDLELSVSSSTRKKLRQHRRRLAKDGPVALVTHSQPDDVRAVLEEFLVLEASGWKGRLGTALLSDERTAAFTRHLVNGLASDGLASIEALRVGERPAAMQVLLRSGGGAFTWKVAYDEAYRDVSPGVLLLEDLTAALATDPLTSVVDSCSYSDESYMAGFWKDRQTIGDVLIDARPRGSFSFVAASAYERAYRRMRDAVKAGVKRLKR